MTKQGKAWATVHLADRDGVEVLFFPAPSQLVQHALIEDDVISVRGRSRTAISCAGTDNSQVSTRR